MVPQQVEVSNVGQVGTWPRVQIGLPARRLADNGPEAWVEVLRRGYEGIVGKDPASAYKQGRTISWLKVKQRDYRKEARGFHQG